MCRSSSSSTTTRRTGSSPGTCSERPGSGRSKPRRGDEAISVATDHRPDVILLDLRLPDMNGTDVARELRRGTGTERIPVVALSASAYAWSSDRLLAAGFDGYLQKPIDVRAFPDQVRGFCKRRGELEPLWVC